MFQKLTNKLFGVYSAQQIDMMLRVTGSSFNGLTTNVAATLDTLSKQAKADMEKADGAIQAAEAECERVIIAAELKRDGIVEAQDAAFTAAETKLREYEQVAAILPK